MFGTLPWNPAGLNQQHRACYELSVGCVVGCGDSGVRVVGCGGQAGLGLHRVSPECSVFVQFLFLVPRIIYSLFGRHTRQKIFQR